MQNPVYNTLLLYEELQTQSDHPHILAPYYVNIRLCSSSTSPEPAKLGFKIKALIDAMGLTMEPFSWLELMRALMSHINVDNIKFLDLGDIGVNRWMVVDLDDVRETLTLFTSVATVQLSTRYPLVTKIEVKTDRARQRASHGTTVFFTDVDAYGTLTHQRTFVKHARELFKHARQRQRAVENDSLRVVQSDFK